MALITELIGGVRRAFQSTTAGDIDAVFLVDQNGAAAGLPYTAKALAAVAIGTADAAATFGAAQKRIVCVATAACFINLDAVALAAAGSSGFPLVANQPVTLDGPITAVHVIAAAAGGTLVVYGVS